MYLDNLDPREKHLIILDDLMDETDQRVASLFTKKSHHRNISVMYIVQNLFHRGKHHRNAIWYWDHHVFDIVYESPDKDGFSPFSWSQDHTGKRMHPWHEMIGIVSVRNHTISNT
jgi:hypothetical protein